MHVETYDGWYIRLFDSVNEIMQMESILSHNGYYEIDHLTGPIARSIRIPMNSFTELGNGIKYINCEDDVKLVNNTLLELCKKTIDEFNHSDCIEETAVDAINQNDDLLRKLFDISILISEQEQLIELKYTDACDISKWGSVTNFFYMAHILTGLVDVYRNLTQQFIDIANDLYQTCGRDTPNWRVIRRDIDKASNVYSFTVKNMNDRIRGVDYDLPIRGIMSRNKAQRIAMALYCAIYDIGGCRYLSEKKMYTMDEYASLCKQYPAAKKMMDCNDDLEET